MDIQKLESIILTDARTEAELLIKQTRMELENSLKEQTQQFKVAHKEELDKIKSEFQTKSTSMKSSIEADFHKSIARLKKEKILILKKELHTLLIDKVKKNPDWFIDKAFSQISIQNGNLFISEDLKTIISKVYLESYLKEKHPGFNLAGVDPALETGLMIEFNSVRYIFPIQESIDQFVETFTDKINSLLFP